MTGSEINYTSGDDYVLEFLGFRFSFGAEDFQERVVAAAVRLDLVADKATGRRYPWQEQRGRRACEAARAHAAILRPLGDTVVIMPPLCITAAELDQLTGACEAGIRAATG